MAYENSAGLGVTNQYGPRNTGGSVGQEKTSNSTRTVSINLTGEMLNSGYVAPFYVPKGAKVVKAILRVDEVFAVTTGPVAVGGAAPATNGVALTKAKLEALGTSDVSSAAVGTWSTASTTGTTASEKVKTAITGAVAAGSGKATLVVEYFFKTKV